MMTPSEAAKLLLDSKANLTDGKHRNWQATSNMRKAENALIRAGMTLCPDCQGRGEVVTTIAKIATKCEWCKGSGWDKEREQTCWQCGGSGYIYNERYETDICKTCGGSRVIPCKEKQGV